MRRASNTPSRGRVKNRQKEQWKMLIRRWLSRGALASALARPGKPSGSHIKEKLAHFVETGQIQTFTPAQAAANLQRKNRRAAASAAKNTLSPQKALLLLRSKYDTGVIRSKASKEVIHLDKIKPSDLAVESKMSLSIFESLAEMKSVGRKHVPPKLLLHLLGITPEALLDPFKVTEATLKLLEIDQAPTRAMELCHLARGNAVVALNAVIEWCMDHGKIKWGQKALHDRKRWMIPTNDQTYVLYYKGLADNHEWGALLRSAVVDALSTYDRIKRPLVEVFNAFLLFAMKNYTNNQRLAMEFFERAETAKTFVPDCQTFTIFLNGRKRYIQDQVAQIKDAPNISATERTRQLFAAQAELVETATNVYKKVMALAMPPVPPTKEEAEADPGKLEHYRKQTSRLLMDIDPVFASTFLQCFVNNFSGTSVTPRSGSHYEYMLQGLEYLKMWCPEVESMLHFAKENDESKVLAPSADIKRRTEERIQEAEVPETDLPLTHVKELLLDEVNPLVVFPPPAFSTNKTRAIFSDKKKRLVDFSRPRFSDINKLVQHQNYINSDGKFGVKLPSLKLISLEKGLGINAFLLSNAVDSILKVGAVKEFYLAMWYILTNWGGIYVSRTDLRKHVAEDLTCGALPKSQYPDLTRARNDKGKFVVKECLVGERGATEDGGEFSKLSLSEKMDLTPPHQPSIVDTMLLENFIYKIDDSFPKRYVPARFITELLAAVLSPTSNLSKSLQPREKTFDAVFSVLKREVYFYNDKNLHKGAVDKRRKKLRNNTPKKSLTAEQLFDVLDPLSVLMRCIMVHEARLYGLDKKRQALMLNKFVESYDNLINHINSTTWIDAPDNHKNAFEVHKKIIGSGILFYTPKELCDPSKNIANAREVAKSVYFVYGALKDRDDLDDKLKKLMLALKSFIQLESKLVDVEEKLRALQWRVYNACK